MPKAMVLGIDTVYASEFWCWEKAGRTEASDGVVKTPSRERLPRRAGFFLIEPDDEGGHAGTCRENGQQQTGVESASTKPAGSLNRDSRVGATDNLGHRAGTNHATRPIDDFDDVAGRIESGECERTDLAAERRADDAATQRIAQSRRVVHQRLTARVPRRTRQGSLQSRVDRHTLKGDRQCKNGSGNTSHTHLANTIGTSPANVKSPLSLYHF